MAEVGNCPIFVAENGNVVHISADSDTNIVNETEIFFSEGRKDGILYGSFVFLPPLPLPNTPW